MNLERRLLLYISPRGGLAMLSSWRSLSWLAEFSATEEGMQQFKDLLLKYRRTPVTLVVDSTDEDYRLEALPHVQGRARQELLSRKLKQIFRNAAFSTAILQGRNPDGRRDDRYLMVSLSDSDWLQPWVNAIHGCGIPFAGMSLMSIAAENLLARLKIRDPHALLVSRQSAGLRLTYFQHGKLRFSRLIRGNVQNNADLDVAEEVSKTQLYLTSQRLFPREGRLAVCLLDLSATLAPAQASLNADPQFEARLLKPDDISDRLGIPADLITNSPEALYLASLKPHFPNLAPRAFSSGYQVHRWRWGLLATGAAALVGSTAMAGWNWLQIRLDEAEMEQLQASIRQYEARYQDTLRHLPQVPLPADSLSRVVGTVAQIEKSKRTPEEAYERLSAVLAHYPAIVLDKLSWQAASGMQNLQAGSERLELTAGIMPFDGNYRAAMEQIKRFMGELQASPGVTEIELTAEPVNTSSSAVLSGTTLDSGEITEARFSLRLKLHGKAS